MERETYLDNVAGVCIIIMILGHIESNSGYSITNHFHIKELMAFFMPWFFYKSGMFFKPKSPMQYLRIGGGKLLVPWLVFTLIALPIYWFEIYTHGDCNWVHYVLSPLKAVLRYGSTTGINPMWFCWSLFLVIMINHIATLRNINTMLLAIGGMCICAICHFYGIKEPLYFANVGSGVFYFCFGRLSRKYNFKYTFYIPFAAYLLLVFVNYAYVDMATNRLLSNGYYLTWFPWTLSAIYVWNFIFKKWNKSVPILNYIGRNSMSLFCTHWIILKLITMLRTYDVVDMDNRTLFLVMITTCIVLLPILNNLFHHPQLCWMIGIKKK